MARSDPQVNVRIPAELKAQLDDAAEKAGRSLTAEIVYRIANSFVSNPLREHALEHLVANERVANTSMARRIEKQQYAMRRALEQLARQQEELDEILTRIQNRKPLGESLESMIERVAPKPRDEVGPAMDKQVKKKK